MDRPTRSKRRSLGKIGAARGSTESRIHARYDSTISGAGRPQSLIMTSMSWLLPLPDRDEVLSRRADPELARRSSRRSRRTSPSGCASRRARRRTRGSSFARRPMRISMRASNGTCSASSCSMQRPSSAGQHGARSIAGMASVRFPSGSREPARRSSSTPSRSSRWPSSSSAPSTRAAV